MPARRLQRARLQAAAEIGAFTRESVRLRFHIADRNAAIDADGVSIEPAFAAQQRSVFGSDSMNSRMDAIWRFSEMNSKAEALIARAPEARDAPMAACITGHSSIS